MDSDLRRLQLTQLEILDVIDDVCKRNHIQYSLYAGTLLGAVRHHGFIPWDDDLDICMERNEYERFIEVWDAEKPRGYLLQNKKNAPGFTQSFTKIRKEHTTFLQFESERRKYHTGIFVDVFPIDRMPVKRVQKVIFLWKCMRYQLLTREYIPPEAGKTVRWISAAILFLTPKKKRAAVLDRDLKYVTSFTDPRLPRVAIERMATMRVPLPSDLTDHFEEILFENKYYPVFKEWDAYLRLKFGDYMTMPPESERIWQHHPIILDFEHSLKELSVFPEKISVLTGIYNCSATLEAAVQSIQKQTYSNWEMILCDDGSTDDTFQTAKRLADADSRIKLLRNEKNEGLNRTLNRCLAASNGSYIARMDGDDESVPERFQKQVDFLREHPEYAFVSTQMIQFDETGDWGRTHTVKMPTAEQVVSGTAFCHAPVMIRRQCLEEVGGYTDDRRMLRVEDVNLWIKLYTAGYRGYNLQETLYRMRNDKNAFQRRKYRYRMNSTYVRLLGCRSLHLGWKSYFKAFKPMIYGLVPMKVRRIIRHRQMNKI